MNSSIKTILVVCAGAMIAAGIMLIPINHQVQNAVNSSIQGLQINSGGGDQLVGGITRVAIGAQTKWTTDLIPSSSFTVNLGSSALPVSRYFGTFASLSSKFEVRGPASASAFTGIAFPASNCTGSTFLQWATTGLFSCGTPSATVASNSLGFGAFVNPLKAQSNVSFTGGAFSFVFDHASVSANFEVVGTASVTGNVFAKGTVTQTVTTGSNSFSGSLNTTLGVHATGNLTTAALFAQTLGTASNSFSGSLAITRQLFANGGLILNTTTSTIATFVATGQLIENTASNSLDFGNAGTQVVIHPPCFTYSYDNPTAVTQWYGKRFSDPFTITEITYVASGSNSVGFNLYYGAPGSAATAVFAANKSASTSAVGKFTAFAASTIADGQNLDLKITSSSAQIKFLRVNICGRYTK